MKILLLKNVYTTLQSNKSGKCCIMIGFFVIESSSSMVTRDLRGSLHTLFVWIIVYKI